MATVLEQAERIVGRKACNWPTLDAVNEAMHDARKAVADMREASKNAVEHLEVTARRHPFASIGVAAAAGLVAGGVMAFALGWLAGRRVRT
jgi:ElaB/YqjD/DUF883 family membrane-anchored ribosome-binding protein